MDRPPSWKSSACPFLITMHTESGQIQQAWVLCDRQSMLAVWDSGRIRETMWNESKTRQAATSPDELWDRELDVKHGGL